MFMGEIKGKILEEIEGKIMNERIEMEKKVYEVIGMRQIEVDVVGGKMKMKLIEIEMKGEFKI